MATDLNGPAIAGSLGELVKWMKLIHGESVAKRFKVVLNSKEKIRAYEATDGSRTVREIAQEVGVKKSTISLWWREWAAMGMVEPGPERGDRPRKLLSLKEIGLL